MCFKDLRETQKQHWNVIEDVILSVIDSISPLVNINNAVKSNKDKIPGEIKTKINWIYFSSG